MTNKKMISIPLPRTPGKPAEKCIILDALRAWINQRPRLDYCNYGSPAPYRAEQRGIARDKDDAERLLSVVAYSDITADDLREAFPRAFCGRLTWREDCAGGGSLSYCCGQYWPTEYRKAAAAVLARAIWVHEAEKLPGDTDKPGLVLREAFRRQFGRGMAARWFD